MVPLVKTYMSARLVYLRAGDRIDVALRPMVELGISAVPVLDDEHRPVRLVTLRDLAEKRAGSERPEPPLQTVSGEATIAEAGAKLVAANIHHLVVVDDDGLAVGMLSALDVVRALVGAEPNHRETIERVPASRAQVGGTSDD